MSVNVSQVYVLLCSWIFHYCVLTTSLYGSGVSRRVCYFGCTEMFAILFRFWLFRKVSLTLLNIDLIGLHRSRIFRNIFVVLFITCRHFLLEIDISLGLLFNRIGCYACYSTNWSMNFRWNSVEGGYSSENSYAYMTNPEEHVHCCGGSWLIFRVM